MIFEPFDPAEELEHEVAAVKRPGHVEADGTTSGVRLQRQLPDDANLGAGGRGSHECHG